MKFHIFNQDEALSRVPDLNLLKELLLALGAMHEVNPENYRNALTADNLTEIDRLSHSLKGMAGNLSLEGLFKAASAINECVRGYTPGDLALLIDELTTEINRFQDWLPSFIKN